MNLRNILSGNPFPFSILTHTFTHKFNTHSEISHPSLICQTSQLKTNEHEDSADTECAKAMAK